MIKSKSELSKDIEIDLTGPEGNAFILLGYASRFAKQLGFTEEESIKLREKMMSGDYENLIETFDDHFGDVVTLYR